MSLAQGNNTPTRPRIEPGSPDPESDALTTRPVRPPPGNVKTLQKQGKFISIVYIIVMASSVSYLKGVRTRFSNTLSNEIKNGTEILSCEKDKIDIEEYLVKVTKCIEKIETYCCKLESQTERLAYD